MIVFTYFHVDFFNLISSLRKDFEIIKLMDS